MIHRKIALNPHNRLETYLHYDALCIAMKGCRHTDDRPTFLLPLIRSGAPGLLHARKTGNDVFLSCRKF